MADDQKQHSGVTICAYGCELEDHDQAGRCYRDCERCPERCLNFSRRMETPRQLSLGDAPANPPKTT